MTNQYIQNCINSRKQEYKSPVSQNAALQKGNKTNIRPERPKGYIVEENALQSVGSSIKGLGKTGVYFVKALDGKGSDYTVGRINDGARLLGSLGIAAAVASTAKNPKAKMMEFVGFSTWFASMSLWPKMIATGIKATKGVDINQEYVDSYGRRKRFFEDAQYITWDLYKDKDLQKMGDKLGVPQNIEDRNSAIKEKAKQVSIQGNTLMMLTAGFATPITTALICNNLENPVSKTIELYQLHNAKKGIEKLSETGLMAGSEKGIEQLGQILGTEKAALLDVNGTRQVRDVFGQFEGSGIGDGISKELKELLGASKVIVKADDAVKKALHGSVSLSDETLKAIVGESPEHLKAVKEAISSLGHEHFNGLVEQAGELNKEGRSGLKRLVKESLGEKLLSVEGLRKETRSKISDAVEKQLHQELKKHSKIEVDSEKLQNLFKVAHDFVARKNVVDLYKKATIGDIADSQTANHWDGAPRKILEALGIDDKTRKLIADNPAKAPEYIMTHLEKIAGDEEKINAVAKIVKKVVVSEDIAARKLKSSWTQIGINSEKHVDDLSQRLFSSTSEAEKISKFKKISENVPEILVKSGKIRTQDVDKFTNKIFEELAKGVSKQLPVSGKMGEVSKKITGVVVPENAAKEIAEAIVKSLVAAKKIEEKDYQKTYEEIAKAIPETTALEISKGLNKEFKFAHLTSGVKDVINLEKTNIENKLISTKSSFYKPLLIIERIKDKSPKEVVKELITGFGIDFWSNKGEHRGIKDTEGFRTFIDRAFAPIEKTLNGEKGLGAKINQFYKKIKAPLSQIDGANRGFYPFGGEGAKALNRSDWAVRVGKSLLGFKRDAATAQGGKNTWLNRVLFIALPLIGITLLAISQFGKKNEYNLDVYEVKGSK